MTLLPSAEHAAGWQLFLDQRLALAVARGSGFAVDLLGSLAQSVGTPVSLHGTGGAWMVLGADAGSAQAGAAIQRSLDRKVCNTLNTLCVPHAEAPRLVPAALHALQQAASARGAPFKLHVTERARRYVPQDLFSHAVDVQRAEGPVREAQAEVLADDALGREWEWEDSPEITLTVVKKRRTKRLRYSTVTARGWWLPSCRPTRLTRPPSMRASTRRSWVTGIRAG